MTGGNISVVSEDRENLSPEEDATLAPNEQDDDDEPNFPAKVNVMIEKMGKRILQIETTAQDDEIVIDEVYYFWMPSWRMRKSRI
ncbi:hypothetical protein IMSHALPRED_004457 [Imshaugia aleurites]|uniref:Uncharacterized protein n=1 Tax=Imshaugia aleurites TaxID=172621 RepID=A0A8H3F6I8_9LECA|nr:hypothetical protein IMSHALPRED_004457 [Imshaugia aleurites]